MMCTLSPTERERQERVHVQGRAYCNTRDSVLQCFFIPKSCFSVAHQLDAINLYKIPLLTKPQASLVPQVLSEISLEKQ